MTFLTGIWGKVAAIGAVALGVLLVIWRIFAKGESVGQARQERKQQKAADKAKAKMDDAKEVKPETGTIKDLDAGGF